MKKLLVCFLLLGLASVSQAAYLYWQVSDSAVEKFASGEGIYGYQLKYGDDLLDIYNGEGTKIADAGTPIVLTGAREAAYFADISKITPESGSFFIELVKYNDTKWDTVGVSEALAYGNINQYTVDMATIAPTIPSAWAGGTYAAPEPTSALLMLLGVAGLALKRRRV